MNADKMNLGQDSVVNVNRVREAFAEMLFRGEFKVEHWRDNVKLAEHPWTPNGITDEGKKKILNLYFYYTDVEVPDDSTYGLYIGLINTGASLAATDIYATHAGWTEYANYKVSAADKRGEWVTGAATGTGTVSITNGTPITYDIDGAGGTVYGIMIVSGAIAEIELQSDTSAGNVLWATGAFASEIPVISGDQLKITYTVNC